MALDQCQIVEKNFQSQDQFSKITWIHFLMKNQEEVFTRKYISKSEQIEKRRRFEVNEHYAKYICMNHEINKPSKAIPNLIPYIRDYLSALYGEENIGEKEKVRQLIEKRCTAKYPQFRRYSVYLKMKNRVRRRMLKQILLSYADPTLTSEELSEERERLFEKYMSIQQMTVHEKQNQPFDGAEGREANQIFEFLEHFHFKNLKNPEYQKIIKQISFNIQQQQSEIQIPNYFLQTSISSAQLQ